MTPTLAPMAWTMFAQAALPPRADAIAIVNRIVNRGIDPEYGTPPKLDVYRIWPERGWCHDYAVTKRYELMLRGFPASDCLLCECETSDGTRHMVLRVGDIVLDNLTDELLPMRYKVVRQQSAGNPDLWEAP